MRALGWWGISLALGVSAMAQEHAAPPTTAERPVYGKNCQLFPTGRQRQYQTYGPGSFAPDGKSSFGVSRTEVPQIANPDGTTASVPIDGRILSSGYSSTGKNFFTAVAGQGVTVWDSAGKKANTVNHRGNVTVAQFSPDGKLLLSADSTGSVQLTGVGTGHRILADGFAKPVSEVGFSENGAVMAVASRDGTVKVFGLPTAEVLHLTDHGDSVDAVALSTDGSVLVSGGRDGTSRVTNLKTGQQFITKHGDWVRDVAVSSDGKFAAAGDVTGAVKVIDTSTGEVVRQVKHDGQVTHLKFTPDGKHLVSGSDKGKVKITDVYTGEEKGSMTHQNRVNSVAVSPDGRLVASASRDGFAKIWDIVSGRELLSTKHGGFVDSVEFTRDGRTLLTKSARKLLATDLDPVCVEKVPSYQAPRRMDEGQDQIEEIVADLCPKEFNAGDWTEWTPSVVPNSLTYSMARKFLYRFQKPGGFEPKAHLPILMTILESDLREREPDLVAGALQVVSGVSTQLYDSLIDRYKIRLKSTDKQICRTDAEKKRVEGFGKEYVASLINKHTHSPTKFGDWAGLGPFTGQLTKLNDAEKERYLHDISDSLQFGASLTPAFADLFHSKLYYYSHEAAGEYFGTPANPLRTEVATVRDQNRIRVMLLGTQPIDGDKTTMTEHGFAAKLLGEIPLRQSLPPGALDIKGLGFNPDVAWTHAGKKYSAHLNGNVLASIAETVPRAGAYPHDELWADKKMTGFVFAGANAGEWSALVADHYIGYYQGRGYEFGATTPVTDLLKFMGDKIRSGEVDYLIKEAHSGGDEKNLVEIPKDARVKVGTKKLPDGRTEQVYVVFPPEKKGSTTWIGNDEFGSWVRQREKDGKGTLVYFNNSCWSYQKALYEIETTYSKKLVDVSTATVAYFFMNTKNNPKIMIYDDLLTGKDFDHTRARLMADEQYRSETGNVFMFPDEERYKTKIIDKLKVPVVMDIKMLGETGKPHFPGRPPE